MSNNRKYFFGYYRDRSQLTCCTWIEHDGLGIGPGITFIQKVEITEKECEDTSINELKLKYPLNDPENL